MIDGKSLSSANSLLQYESTKGWLSKHKVAKNQIAIEKFDKIKQNESIKQWMLEGLVSDVNRNTALASNMLFTCKSPKKIDWSEPNVSFYGDHFEESLKVVSEFDRDKEGATDRLLAGMNPSTLMTEYRRKITIQALLDSGDTKEDRKVAVEKLQILIDLREKEKEVRQLDKSFLNSTYGNEESKIHLGSSNNKLSKISSSNSSSRTGGQFHKDLKNSRSSKKHQSSEFKAKWEHFDVMKDRWRYLLPQTRDLLEPSSCIAPTSSSMAATSAFLVEGDLVTGTYREVAAFKERQKSNRQSNIHTSDSIPPLSPLKSSQTSSPT